ncbi:hypothetical protein RSAG8_03862, partial [Rhizoctonia solani AG-8 WAC10335]
MAKAAPLHVKDIREQARSASLKAVAGFSALSILHSAQALADAGLALEHDGDLRGALFKYSQAAILLDHIMSSAEYKHEWPKSQRGVFYHQTAKLSEFVIGDILPRAKKIEERLREIEHSQPQPPSPPAAEPDGRPMGSLRDRMRMLEQAGLDVGNQPHRPPKPAKPTADPAASKHIDPPLLKPMPPLEPASPPSSRGTSSIQHDLAYLNNITGTNGGAPPSLNGALSPPTQFTTLPSAPQQFNPSSAVATPITGMFGITGSVSPGGSSTATMTTPARPSLPPNSTGGTSPGGTAPAPLVRSITGDRASITSRASTAGTNTPPLSKSALWNSPQHTGTGMSGVTSNGTGGRSLPLSPLATGGMSPLATGGAGVLSPRATGGDSLGLGLGLNETDEPPRPPPQRSTTTEAFEAAFPSIDDIEATFPSLDALESEAEMKLLKLGVPTSAPGLPPLGDTPTLGFEFGQKSPVPRSFPNAIPDLEGAPRPASTPTNGARPGITFGSAKSQSQSQSPRPPATPTTQPDPPKSDKLPKPHLPITNTITAKTLKGYLATALQILVLDVRPRDEFDSRRIPLDNAICIEPIVLGRKGMSAKELQEALILSSKTERTLFEQRNIFDLVVLTDASSTEFKDPTTPLNLLFRIIYETEFLKPLRRSPVFLYGGIKAWGEQVGEFKGEDAVLAPSADAGKGLARKPAVSGRANAGSVSYTRMPQDMASPAVFVQFMVLTQL